MFYHSTYVICIGCNTLLKVFFAMGNKDSVCFQLRRHNAAVQVYIISIHEYMTECVCLLMGEIKIGTSISLF